MISLRSLALALLAINAVLTGLLQSAWTARDQATDRVSFFPARIGDWQGQDIPLQQWEIDLLRTEDLVFRRYRRGDRSVQLLLSWSANDFEAVHPSDDCYTAAGWDITGRDPVSFEVPGRPPLSALVKEVRRGGEVHLFFDLFRTADGWSTGVWGHLWQLLRRSLVHRDPAGGKLRLDTVVGPGGRRAALARLQEFLVLIQPRLEKDMR